MMYGLHVILLVLSGKSKSYSIIIHIGLALHLRNKLFGCSRLRFFPAFVLVTIQSHYFSFLVIFSFSGTIQNIE